MRIADPRHRRPHFVYLLKVGDLLKIGCSNDPRVRLGAVAPQKHGGGELLATIRFPNRVLAHDAEIAAHHRFARHLARPREWFNDHRDIRGWFRCRADERPHCLVERIRFELDTMPYRRGCFVAPALAAAEHALGNGEPLDAATLAALKSYAGRRQTPLARAMRDAAALLADRWGCDGGAA